MPWGLVALVRTEGLRAWACLMALDQVEKKWLMAGWFLLDLSFFMGSLACRFGWMGKKREEGTYTRSCRIRNTIGV